MKTDNYLSLCLEQAAKSPLHFRHGCIVVRGGKVVGQGFNDYRPGYIGGALKTGRISSANNGPAMVELKQRLKNKGKPEVLNADDLQGKVSFMPFETFGYGRISTAPLSMHSEMMAVLSVLNVSRTLSSTVLSLEKPNSKSSSESKRKERLQAYVSRICETSSSSGKLQVQECGFEACAYQPSVFVERQPQQCEYERGANERKEEELPMWTANSVSV